MSKDVKSDAPKRDWCYLGDDHCPEHGHGCEEYWCGNGPATDGSYLNGTPGYFSYAKATEDD